MNIKELLNPVLIWFLVGFVMFVLEMATPGLIMFFFGVGAWIVAILAYMFKISLNMQLFLYIVCSVLSLIIFRKWLKQLFHGFETAKQNPSENIDEFIGHKALVTKSVSPGQAGKVEFKGTLWDAEAESEIPAGSKVEIIRKDSLTLYVKKT